MRPDEEGDLFALLSAKEELLTKNGKPYFRVTFRDYGREVSFPVWSDSAWAVACRDEWQPGRFYKLRAAYRETQYGPQLEIQKIREATDQDRAEGFDPAMCRPASRFDPQAMFNELREIAEGQITPAELSRVVVTILDEHRDALLTAPAARHNHHAFAGGLLEHTLSVTRSCVFLAERYAEYYAEAQPPLHAGLAVAGGILHDIGKLRELDAGPAETSYTAEGAMIGHLVLGRDMVRQAAEQVGLDEELRLRLEHLLLAHQRLPEWGSPKPPMTPEALLVHMADDLDAKLNMMFRILGDDSGIGPMTSRRNVLGHALFRGLDS
jgi:3'-5' exoribonuclease